MINLYKLIFRISAHNGGYCYVLREGVGGLLNQGELRVNVVGNCAC